MKAKKSLGQNFLICPWVASKMVKSAELKEGEVVVEIGPGRGALTKKLLESGAKVLAIEKDKELCQVLNKKFEKEIKAGQLEIVEADVLELVISGFFDKMQNYKLIANIPYYITGAILKTFLSLKNKPKTIVLLVQKEVAERIVSAKGSVLSLSVKFYGSAQKLFNVSKKCFKPQPKVDSAVIKIDIFKNNENLGIEKEFFKVLHAAFKQKRKKLINNLKAVLPEERLKDFFEKHELDKNIRAEDLDIERFVEIAKLLKL